MKNIEKVVIVKPPINVGEDVCFFSRRKYKISPLNTLILKNIVVTSQGLCFQKSKLIKESVQKYPDKVRIFELSGQLQLINSPTIEMDDDQKFLIIHHPWLNYYHWITESIPKLWLLKDKLNSLVLLLPAYYKGITYVMESLKPFNFKSVRYIPNGYNVRIENAVIPQIKPICSNYDPDFVDKFREFYSHYVLRNLCEQVNLGQRIYIIRGNSKRRKIVNEKEVIGLLECFDFKAINVASYSFFEQVSFSINTKYLISNGSGLTNMSFMKKHTNILEMYKKNTNINDFHDLTLWYLASALDINYFHQCCDPINVNEDMYYADLLVDLKMLEKNVKLMCNR